MGSSCISLLSRFVFHIYTYGCSRANNLNLFCTYCTYPSNPALDIVLEQIKPSRTVFATVYKQTLLLGPDEHLKGFFTTSVGISRAHCYVNFVWRTPFLQGNEAGSSFAMEFLAHQKAFEFLLATGTICYWPSARSVRENIARVHFLRVYGPSRFGEVHKHVKSERKQYSPVRTECEVNKWFIIWRNQQNSDLMWPWSIVNFSCVCQRLQQ